MITFHFGALVYEMDYVDRQMVNTGFLGRFLLEEPKPVHSSQPHVRIHVAFSDCEATANCDQFYPFGEEWRGIGYKKAQWLGDRVDIYVSPNCRELLNEKTDWGVFLFAAGIYHSFLPNGLLLLHASYLETPMGAILFAAKSGTGKSTQAELWRRHLGATVVNGDRVLLAKQDGVWYAHGLTQCGTSEISLDRSNPVRAIVCLSQGEDNVVAPLRPGLAFAKLMAGCGYLWDDPVQQQLAEALVLQLVKDIEIVQYACTMEPEAAYVLDAYLKQDIPKT